MMMPVTTALSNETVIKLSSKTWGNPQNTKEILHIRPLTSIMRKLTHRPAAKLSVLYHGDDKGTKWASDFRSWLISLGLKSERIILSPDNYTEDTLELKIKN